MGDQQAAMGVATTRVEERILASLGKLYHGRRTQLPRRYVARQRLCLRGTTDYWVNAMDGQPFFVVTQAADPGLLQTLETEIIPRLLAEVPGQPTEGGAGGGPVAGALHAGL